MSTRGPLVALDTQLDLWRWAKRHAHDRLVHLDRTAERRLAPPHWHGDDWADSFARSLLIGLGGQTMWIGPDIAPLIEQAATTVPPPDGAIGPGTIGTPAGTAWIGGEPARILYDTAVVAVTWSVQTWPMTSSGTFQLMPAVVIWPWASGDRLPELLPPVAVPVAAATAAMMPDGHDELVTAFGRMDWAPDEWAGEAMAITRWALAMWVFARQILPQHIVSPPRPLRRRGERAGMPPEWGDIHVVTLRKQHRGGDGEPAEEEPWHSHRWIVSGHWRWQPCGPAHQERRLTWIRQHVKGPEGAPLIELEQVAKLVR